MDLIGAVWRKSGYSGTNGGDRNEGAAWRKSSHSGGSGGNCVEIAGRLDFVAVRDSKDPDGPALTFTRPAWRAFTTQLKRRSTRA